MQNTGLANYSSFLVWKRVSPMDVVTFGLSTTIFLCIRPFPAWWQPDDPSASLLFTSEKAVFCESCRSWKVTEVHYDVLSGLEEMIDVVWKKKLEILSDKQERFPRLCLTLGLLFEWQTEWAAGLGEVSCWGLVVLSHRSICSSSTSTSSSFFSFSSSSSYWVQRLPNAPPKHPSHPSRTGPSPYWSWRQE